jgi:hypothetical protein
MAVAAWLNAGVDQVLMLAQPESTYINFIPVNTEFYPAYSARCLPKFWINWQALSHCSTHYPIGW